ncbi:hypothetical protein CHUAL_006046 [Chamberlinius hualienensis]
MSTCFVFGFIICQLINHRDLDFQMSARVYEGGEFSIMQPHTLHPENVPSDLESDLATQLIQLQLRELSSLDYEILLRLDDRVKPKTLQATQLATFYTEVVAVSSTGNPCAICKEEYIAGQIRKYLPCKHGFHKDCIDMWLSQQSVRCPLDGLSISPT